MTSRFARPLAAVCLVASCVITAHAAGARFWQVSTQTDFLAGEVENLSIDMHGRLLLGPQAARVGDSTTPFVWRIVPGPEGSIYAGTGNDGQVFRFAADGTRTVFFDAPELEVHALAPAPGGGLYVGTSPDGKIYRVDAKGAETVYFDPDDKYIWSLAVDPAGTLYAGTGEKGLIYRITAEGKGEVFYRTKAAHATTLLLERVGDLLAGTESPGKIFRLKKDGSGFLLLDTGFQEISALRVDPAGIVHAAAFSGKPAETRGPEQPAPEAPRPQPIPSVSTEITSVAIVDVSGAAGLGGPAQPASREPRKAPRGAVFRILPDGGWDTVWSLPDDAPYDVLPEPGGTLLVATGNKGKIYRVAGEPARATLVARADAQQVTDLFRDGKGDIWFATSNPGKLFRLSASQATAGTYRSDIRDAETVATWGTISWRGSAPAGTSVKLFTRSGNTSVPDETWSPWSSAYTRSDGEQIDSPKARYLQWKTDLAGAVTASPVVTSVTVAYLQRNLRPEVSSITLHPPGVVFQKPFSSGDAELAGFDGSLSDRRGAASAQASGPGAAPPPSAPALGRRTFQKGFQTLIWKAEDENEDDLLYDVVYRREGETAWKPLKRGLQDPIFVWDTTSVPNGTYVVKIIATDAPGNPPGTALTGERESRSFDIDNAPPIVTVGTVRRDGTRTIVEFTVRDDQSAVQRVEYSLDADRWRTIYPKDGIADSPTEQFELAIDGDATERAVILRAVDGMNNVATARAEAPRR